MLDDKPSRIAIMLRLRWLAFMPAIKTITLTVLGIVNLAVLTALTMATVQLLQERQSYINALEALGNPAPLIAPGAGFIKPQTLILQEQGVLTHAVPTGMRHDFYALVHNPNVQWLAKLRFRFIGPNYEGPWQQGFVAPNEDMYLTSLGITLKEQLQTMQLDIDDLHFQRATDYQKRKQLFLPLRIEELSSTNLDSASPSTTFTLNNPGPSSFTSLPIAVVASQGGRVVQITTLTLQNVPAFTKRPVTIRWTESVPLTSSMRILPLINVYDLNQFLESSRPVQTF